MAQGKVEYRMIWSQTSSGTCASKGLFVRRTGVFGVAIFLGDVELPRGLPGNFFTVGLEIVFAIFGLFSSTTGCARPAVAASRLRLLLDVCNNPN